MNIVIITIGSRSRTTIKAEIDAYQKRLPKHVRVSWEFISHGNGSPTISKQHEAEAILRKIPQDAFVILLDEKGKNLSSEEHAEQVFGRGYKTVVYVIGGAYGVDERVTLRANHIWSLSKLVFPHQLVRLILTEQVYRAYTIHSGHPYHHV